MVLGGDEVVPGAPPGAVAPPGALLGAVLPPGAAAALRVLPVGYTLLLQGVVAQ